MTSIAIIGAHGKIGLLLARTLADHDVRGVFRNPDHADEVAATGATPVVLDIERATAEELAAALPGVEAFVFTAGAGGGSGPARKETVDHQGAVKSLAAAGILGARRFVVVSYIGADDPASGGTDESMIAYQKAKSAADDAVRASDLDWTIVRPGSLNDDPATGLVATGDVSGTTSRANTAAVIAAILEGGLAVREVVNVVDGATPIADAL